VQKKFQVYLRGLRCVRTHLRGQSAAVEQYQREPAIATLRNSGIDAIPLAQYHCPAWTFGSCEKQTTLRQGQLFANRPLPLRAFPLRYKCVVPFASSLFWLLRSSAYIGRFCVKHPLSEMTKFPLALDFQAQKV
jgi:hypothetical protein